MSKYLNQLFQPHADHAVHGDKVFLGEIFVTLGDVYLPHAMAYGHQLCIS